MAKGYIKQTIMDLGEGGCVAMAHIIGIGVLSTETVPEKNAAHAKRIAEQGWVSCVCCGHGVTLWSKRPTQELSDEWKTWIEENVIILGA